MAEGVVPPPPWEEEAKKKGIPPPPWEAPESTFSRIEQLKAKAPKGEVARKARTHLTNIGMGQAAATQEQENRDAYARAAGQAVEMLPFAAAVPLTGGASLGVGLGLMGAAGVAGGLARIGVKSAMGSSEIPQTAKAVAAELGIDAVTGMLGEGTGRVGSRVISEFIPALIQRSAVKHELGQRALQTAWDDTRNKLDALTSNHFVDVTDIYQRFHDTMATLPKGTGKTGALLTAFKEKVNMILRNVAGDLKMPAGGTTVNQRLDALIEMKGQLNSIAWDKELNRGAGRQLRRLKDFADEVNGQIKTAIKALPDAKEAMALYNKANSFMKILDNQSAGIIMTEKMIGRMVGHGAVGAGAVGGYAGYQGYRRGGVRGALEYGAAGALSGAAAGAMQAAVPRISTWAFELMANHPVASGYVKKAIQASFKGESAHADAQMVRAAGIAEIRDAIKEAIRHPEVIAPTVPPQ